MFFNGKQKVSRRNYKDYWWYFCVYPFQFNSTNVFFMCNSWLTNVYIFQRCELAYSMKNWQCKNIFMKKLKEKKSKQCSECHSNSKRTEKDNDMTDYNSPDWWNLRLVSLTCNRSSSKVIQYFNLSNLSKEFWFLSALHPYWVLIVLFIRIVNMVKKVHF